MGSENITGGVKIAQMVKNRVKKFLISQKKINF